jgi:hypothetical protein
MQDPGGVGQESDERQPPPNPRQKSPLRQGSLRALQRRRRGMRSRRAIPLTLTQAARDMTHTHETHKTHKTERRGR